MKKAELSMWRKPKSKRMITKRYEYTDSWSDKFWEITYPEDGKSYTASWGKRGTLGTSKTKHKTSLAEIEKKIREKLNKGYVEKTVTRDKRAKSNPTEETRDPSPFDIY